VVLAFWSTTVVVEKDTEQKGTLFARKVVHISEARPSIYGFEGGKIIGRCVRRVVYSIGGAFVFSWNPRPNQHYPMGRERKHKSHHKIGHVKH
jgi:hypothetical protein